MDGRARHRPAKRGHEDSLLRLEAPCGRGAVRPRERWRGELDDDLGRLRGARLGSAGGAEDGNGRGCGEDGEGGERARHR